MMMCLQTTQNQPTVQHQPKNSCKPADFRQILQFTCAHYTWAAGIVSMSVCFTTRSKDHKKRPGGETGHGSNPQQPMPQQALTNSLERQFREAKKMRLSIRGAGFN